jgi:hypothetical protein
MNKDVNIIYRLNSQDEFIYVNEEWTKFAIGNDAPDLLPENVLRRPVWDFISDMTTEQLYREILRHVRAGRPASFTFRCDAPEYRRHMEMTIAELGGGNVQFQTRPLQVEERPRQALVDRYAPRSDDLLRICGWCKRVDVGGGRWGEVEEAVTALLLFEGRSMPLLTHGICEDCDKRIREQVAKLRARA